MAQSPIETGLRLRAAAEGVLGGTIGQFVAADPAVIPAPLRPFQAGYRRMCDIYARTGLVGSVVTGGAADGICGGYLGADAPVLSPANNPPFQGGQCPIFYNVNATVSGIFPSNGQPISRPFTGTARGPLTGISIERTTGNNWLVRLNGAQGISTNFLSTVKPTLVINSLTPQGGGADDCGDLPGEPEGWRPVGGLPPDPPTPPVYIPVPGIEIPITIGNINVNIDGRLTVLIGVGNVSFDGFAGEPGGDAPEVPSGERSSGSGTPTQSEGGGEEDTPERPGERCVGVSISINNPPLDWGIISGGGSNNVFPRIVGNVSLLCELDGGGNFWSSDHRLYSQRSAVFRPHDGLTIVRWRVKLITSGVNFFVTPIYVEV